MTPLALVALSILSAPEAKGVTLPGGRVIESVDFERHVVALFGRMGCASGSCHGSFQGKGGFQLSLFGYDPAKDHAALVRQNFGRRLDQATPEDSLLLKKATGAVEHGGLTRFNKSSWQYRLLHGWIAQGAKRVPGSGDIKSVKVNPPELALKGTGTKGQIKVEATFKDDTTEDITSLCEFRSNDDAVVEVNGDGAVKGLRPGDTAIVISYRGTVLPVRVMVPVVLPEGKTYPQVQAANYIDAEVFAKLKRLNIIPSELSSDSEFLRRVTLDTIGTLPTPAEVRAFLADNDPKKREKAIDRLLAHPMHAALWATKLCDITGNNTDALENPPQRKPFLSQMWHDWFRRRMEKNVPYDQIVRGVLTATSLEGKTPEEYVKFVSEYEEAHNKGEKTKYAERETLDLFWRKQARVTIEEWGEKTAVAFLGVRLECAQCHKHPFDRWTQADYRSYANVFSALATVGASPKSAKVFKEAQAERQQRTQQAMAAAKKSGKPVTPGLPVAPLREVFIGARGKPLTHPETNAALPMQALGGPELKYKAGEDPRVALMDWMVEKDNPFFAPSFVNRVWGHYLGVGIVHPVDDFSLANPPSNPKLLAALAKDFVESKFDIRAIEKKILMSRAYQLSSKPNETNRLDKNNYARGYVRPLMAEVVVDVLNAALGAEEKWTPGEAAAGSRAIEVGASRVTNANVNHIFRVFGRSPRTATCDCERAAEPALPQKLFLLADPILLTKLKSGSTRITQVLKDHADDREALDELFTVALARPATERDWKVFQAHKEKKKPRNAAERRELFGDVMWALVNTSEFIFNH